MFSEQFKEESLQLGRTEGWWGPRNDKRPGSAVQCGIQWTKLFWMNSNQLKICQLHHMQTTTLMVSTTYLKLLLIALSAVPPLTFQGVHLSPQSLHTCLKLLFILFWCRKTRAMLSKVSVWTVLPLCSLEINILCQPSITWNNKAYTEVLLKR